MKNEFFKFSSRRILFSTVMASALLAGSPQTVFAEVNGVQTVMQTGTVKGQVVDATGEPVIGATVQVKGTTNGTITDFDGNFTLNNVPEKGILVISYIGYKTQEVNISGKTNVKVVLKEDTEVLDEVVVVGYGAQKKASLTSSISQIKGDEDMAQLFLQKAKQFVVDNKERPFFLYYGLHQPHVPRVPNERFIGKSGMGPRGDVILEADWCVDEFLKELDRLGLAENTIVILTSDNGPVLDDGYKDQAVELVGKHRPAGPLRGWKTTMYDGGVRVPFMLRWPAMVKPGVSDAFVCQMDLLASFAGLLGQTYPDKLDSRNTLKAFLGKSKKGREELVIEGMFNYAYRKGDWALIPPYRKQTEYQLYNLKEDIGQKHNLADKYPKKVKELTDEFEALKLSTGKKTRF